MLRKSPVAPNVSFDFTADLTQDFTGADITELCQRAAKAAIRESIFAEEERRRLAGEGGDQEMDAEEVADPVPVIGRQHFEEAFHAARRSVTTHDLYKFDEFRKKFDPVYAKKQGGQAANEVPKIAWPENVAAMQVAEDDDDLYD